MATYTTSLGEPRQPRRSIGGTQGQARAVRALLHAVYGAGAKLDANTVAAWAEIVLHWPPAEDQPPQPPV